MNPRTRKTLRISTLFALIATLLATTRFAANTTAQHLQQGVSVQLAPTANALPMPAADNEDAWIVAITADGKVYFGVDPVDPASLADVMKSRPRKREQMLYIKADARTPFANVARVLEAGRKVWFDTPILLTSQPSVVAKRNGRTERLARIASSASRAGNSRCASVQIRSEFACCEDQ